MQPYHLDQLSTLCKSHPVQTKVVFVPSMQVGYNLTTALTASGQAWLNLRITTPAAWAEQLVGPRLKAEGWRALPRDMVLFYLGEILDRVLQNDLNGHFPGLSAIPGLTRSFLRTLQALRLADVGSAVLEETQIEFWKTRLLGTLYREYSRRLEEERYYDDAYLYAEARELLLKEGGGDGQTIYAILDETPVSGVALQYVETLTGNRIYRIGREDYGISPPSHSAAARFQEAPFPEGPVNVGGGGRLLLDGGLSPEDRESLQLKKALGVENEVRGVFREILHQEIPLDDVEIAYTAESPYLGLLHDAAEYFETQVAFAVGFPVTLTRPGQALTGFYRWIGSDFDAGELICLCRAGLLTFNEVTEPGGMLESYHLAMLLQQSPICQGRDGYASGLDRLQQGFQQRIGELDEGRKTAGHRETEQALLSEARGIVDMLLALVPTNRVPLSQVTDASAAFLRTFAPIRNEHDAMAMESLTQRLQQIGATVEVEGPVERLVLQLGELIVQHNIEPSAARPGHVYVVPLERAGYTNRKHLYVVGMNEGTFPGGAIEDPILLDDERSELSGELTLGRTRPGEQVWHVMRTLGAAMGKVTLLASCRSLTDGGETYPSALFQQAQEQLFGENQDTLPVHTPVPEPEEALDDVEAMLSVRKASGFREAVREAYPWLVAGQVALQSREQAALTRFDGWLGHETPELGVADGKMVVSASRLETLTACPYRYFLRYVLHVEPPDESDAGPARWLTPLEFGALLHDLFCTFMVMLQGRGEFPDQDKHAHLLEEMLHQEIDRCKEHIPILHEAAYRADCSRLEKAAQIFLAVESKREGIEPVGFEVSFGFGRGDGLNQAEPVKLRLSDRLMLSLRGRIDRVDRAEDGYEIWDYKTGSMRPYDETDLLKGGLHLQWALYAHALEHILHKQKEAGRVLRSGYFFTSDRENGRRIGDGPPTLGHLADLLEPLFDLTAQGCFFHVQKEDGCDFCDYSRLCAGEKRLARNLKDIREAPGDNPEILDKLSRWIGV